jgi:SAM-dependent methyltransferase
MIGVDASAEMLAEATGAGGEILYLQQPLTKLDLYGTVDAALCTLDGLNYLPAEDLEKALRRIFLFLHPGGVFAFDLHTPEKLKGLEGEIFCDEREDLLCLWRCGFDEGARTCTYDLDLFHRHGDLWRRRSETHVQYAFTAEEIGEMLEQAGFCEVTITGGADRMFVAAVRPEGV